MKKLIQMDELHVTVLAPVGVAAGTYSRIVRNLRSRSFKARLQKALSEAFETFPALTQTRFKVTR